MRIRIRGLVIFLFLLSTAVYAHHGWTEFDLNREITLEANVIDFHFVNPHSVVEFEIIRDPVPGRKWQGEFASPSQLIRKGWSASTLQPGDNVALTGHPAKNGVPAIYVQRIHMPDGQEVAVEGR